MALLALVMATAGTSYGQDAYSAAKKLISGKQIKKNAITTRHIKKGAVRSSDVKNGSLLAKDFKTGQLAAGPQGPAGPAGPQGPAEPAGKDLGAVCAGNDPADVMVKVGGLCIDRYEASVWSKPDGGVQYGVDTDDYPCADNGQDCKGNIFARSVAGVTPSSRITWFQAQRALKNSGKQLPSNAQWQQAVAGTPDSTACNVSTGNAHTAGQDAGCVSEDGVNDMVGNLWEWVADWTELADNCTTLSAAYGTDVSCMGNDGAERERSPQWCPASWRRLRRRHGRGTVRGLRPQPALVANGSVGFRGGR